VWWAAMRVMYAGKSATGVLEARNEWHRRQEAIDAAIFAASSTDLWPALFAPVRHGNVEVRPVTDGLSLREEGSHGPDRNGVAGMGHCVATRRPKLLRGEAHVLSIRRLLPDGGYERLSTAQVEVGPHGGIRLAEHKGPGNAEPPPEANAALQAVLAAAGQGVLKLNPEALERRGDAAGPDLVSFECQYDWRDPEAIATALRAWEPCLPRWLRGATPAEAFDLLRERGWLDDLAPDVGPSLPLP